MKKSKIILPIILLLLVSLMVSCENAVSSDEAKDITQNMFECIENDLYEDAASLMHPSRHANAEFLQSYIEEIEQDTGADFSNGIEIDRQIGFSSSLYDSEVKGSRYEIEYVVKIGEYRFEADIEVVRNDDGFGIYDIEFDLND
jgi:hypothetical protein